MAPLPRELLGVLACPACRRELRARGSTLGCSGCGSVFAVPNGIPDLRCELDARTDAVREFYTAAPFPGYPPRDDYSALRARAERSEFARLLDHAIAPDATVLELGCGAFDVVYCSGVLHHTPDPEASFRAIAPLVRPGGVIVIGLYNAYARLPHRLRRAVARLTKLRWIPFDPVLRDRATEPARRLAWLRDQYRHPEEHRHTLAEVQRWFRASGVAFVRTYPSAVIAERAADCGGLFTPAADDWGLESVLHQLCWSWTLGREGGLFVVIGRRSVARTSPAPARFRPDRTLS